MSTLQNCNKLIKLRKKTKLSQDAIEKRLGLGRNVYQSYEKGVRNLPISSAKRIAAFFGVNWWELYE